ncbi:MAG TPA: HEAT repeat domain-containing protein [Gemmatimonadales bacterium]|nr:HEAT repeat domain-containing protein [Gemmatimonadales bacterium]
MNRLGLLLALLGASPSLLPAQDAALVGDLAPILMAEDRRVLDTAVFARAMEHPDPLVRKTAITAMGRIGDHAGLRLILPRLSDRDPGVIATAFFALGLLGDTMASGPILDRLRQGDSLTDDALAQAATSLARLADAHAARAVRDVVGDVGELAADRRAAMRSQAAVESWRLGERAPVEQLLTLARDSSAGLRWRATYALGRLQTAAAGDLLVSALRDPIPLIRETAAKALTRRFADTAGLDPHMVVSELARAFTDRTPGVRINALQAVATFADSSIVGDVLPLMVDEDRTVRIAAAGALGAVGGHGAVAVLVEAVHPDKNDWGVRQAAFLALARLDPAAFAPVGEAWLGSPDPFDRLTAIDAWSTLGPTAASRIEALVDDPDSRVRGAALSSWVRLEPAARDRQRAAALRAWQGDDQTLRATALRVLAPTPTDAALDLLVEAWQGGGEEIRETVLGQLAGWARRDPGVIERLAAPSRRAILERPDDAELRSLARRQLPMLAEVWGPVAPIETGRTLEDYRQLVSRYLLATENPKVTIEVDRRGTVELELLPREAPLTVANFLRLVDRRYFDNGRWHRVVPNFVVQDGDPTGTGSGGPGWSIRDEINRLHYDVPMLGMALSGPDTGGSQWFINLSPQPHLDGGYTIFGKVTGSVAALRRILPGDRIRSIHRGAAP